MTIEEFNKINCAMCGSLRCPQDKEAISTCGHYNGDIPGIEKKETLHEMLERVNKIIEEQKNKSLFPEDFVQKLNMYKKSICENYIKQLLFVYNNYALDPMPIPGKFIRFTDSKEDESCISCVFSSQKDLGHCIYKKELSEEDRRENIIMLDWKESLYNISEKITLPKKALLNLYNKKHDLLQCFEEMKNFAELYSAKNHRITVKSMFSAFELDEENKTSLRNQYSLKLAAFIDFANNLYNKNKVMDFHGINIEEEVDKIYPGQKRTYIPNCPNVREFELDLLDFPDTLSSVLLRHEKVNDTFVINENDDFCNLLDGFLNLCQFAEKLAADINHARNNMNISDLVIIRNFILGLKYIIPKISSTTLSINNFKVVSKYIEKINDFSRSFDKLTIL